MWSTCYPDLRDKIKKFSMVNWRAKQMHNSNQLMGKLRRQYSKACACLADIDVCQWCLIHDGNHHQGIITMNISKSYTILRGMREMSIKACIDLIFYRIIKFFNKNRKHVAHNREPLGHYQEPFPPKIQKKNSERLNKGRVDIELWNLTFLQSCTRL